MSKVQLAGNASGTGIFTIASPNSNTDRTLTLPNVSGTFVSTGDTGTVSQTMLASGVAGNGPAFCAYPSGSQSISAATNTKVVLNVEEFDTNSCFNTSTYAFTPTVAGYYFVQGNVYSGALQREAILYKNGGFYKYLQNSQYGGGGSTNGSTLVYLNGTTDYIELYTYMNAGGTVSAGLGQTNFSAFLARAA